MQEPDAIVSLLQERGQRYGAFTEHAHIAQCLKIVIHHSPNWHRLKPDQREALDMIASKMARILNGDPDWQDNWIDMAGYARLVAERLENT